MPFEEWYQDKLPLMPENRDDLKFELREAWEASYRIAYDRGYNAGFADASKPE